MTDQATKDRQARWRAEHPDYNANWQKENPEATCAKSARYREQHFDRELRRHAQYRKENPDRFRRSNHAYRARKLNQFVEHVDPEIVFIENSGRCGICNEMIEGDFHIDHITPLSKGGLHCYANCQPAHPRCNLRKGNRTAYKTRTSRR